MAYYKRLGARERVETGNAAWLNFIMDREALARFLHGKEHGEEEASGGGAVV